MEESAAGPPVGFGNLDAHDPKVEELRHELARDVRLLVHLADQRPDPPLSELADAAAEDLFVFGEGCQRRDVICCLLRHASSSAAGWVPLQKGMLSLAKLGSRAPRGDVQSLCALILGPSRSLSFLSR